MELKVLDLMKSFPGISGQEAIIADSLKVFSVFAPHGLTESGLDVQHRVLVSEKKELDDAVGSRDMLDAYGDIFFVYVTMLAFEKEMFTESAKETMQQVRDILYHLEKRHPGVIYEVLDEVNKSNLSKFAETKDEAIAAVETTYKDILTRVVQHDNGLWMIYSDADQEFNGEVISRNKLLKCSSFVEPCFDLIIAERGWIND